MADGDGRLYFNLQMAAHRLRTFADRRCLEVAGVTAAQAGVLFAIEAVPGRTQRSLATTLGQQESAITTMIRRLEKAGLVEREGRSDDRRAFALRLTRRGSAALDQLRGELDELDASIRRRVGVARARQLDDDLTKLVDLVAGRTGSDAGKV